MKTLRVPAKNEYLDQVTGFVMDQLEEYGCSPRIRYQIELAIEEIFVNISSYAYHPKEGEAEVRCEVLQDPMRVSIQFLDGGTPFDPLARGEVDLSPEAFMNREGGLGIFLVKETMDDVSYTYENGQNILTILKRI